MAKGNDRKLQLLAVALDEFIAKGFYGTSTREIARKAKVSSGLLFHYFPNKESVYLELIKMGTEKMFIDIEKAMNAPKEYLFGMLQETLELLACNPFFAKMFVFMDAAQYTDLEMEEVKKLLSEAEITKQWVPILMMGQEQGVFCEGDPLALCALIFGALQGVAQAKVQNPDLSLPKAEWFMKIVEVEKVYE